VEGIYQEKIPFTEIKKHGDFGLGTFDQLDGEMVCSEGKIYQITADGRVSQVEEDARTPFACVTFYQPISHDELHSELSYEGFLEWVQGLLPSPNIFYAIRIDGLFSSIKVRSVPKQECYRPLVDVAKEQPVFNYSDVQGTLAGFFTPEFMSSLNVPGLHLHFLWRPAAGRASVRMPAAQDTHRSAADQHPGAGAAHEPGLSDLGLPARYWTGFEQSREVENAADDRPMVHSTDPTSAALSTMQAVSCRCPQVKACRRSSRPPPSISRRKAGVGNRSAWVRLQSHRTT
jgi:acetolactate decarboxylase